MCNASPSRTSCSCPRRKVATIAAGVAWPQAAAASPVVVQATQRRGATKSEVRRRRLQGMDGAPRLGVMLGNEHRSYMSESSGISNAPGKNTNIISRASLSRWWLPCTRGCGRVGTTLATRMNSTMLIKRLVNLTQVVVKTLDSSLDGSNSQRVQLQLPLAICI